MNVFILTEGNKNTGLGHITRCTSIYQAFEEAGIRPELIVNGNETVHDFVKDKNCKIFDWLNDREALFAALRGADIVFIDSYLADYVLYERISKTVKTCVYFDDNMRIDYPSGFVVNGAIFAEQMPYPEKEGVTYLLGAQYAPLRKEFWNVPAKQICDGIEVIMVAFGGTDIHNLTPKILELLQDAYPKLIKKVVVGKGFQNTTEIEALEDHSTELIYYPDAAEMKKVMLESDIAISASGQTLYELARIGTPTVGICIADNQQMSMENWEKAGFLEYVGWYDQKDLLDRLKKAISKLPVDNERRKRSRIGKKYVDGKGPSRIVDSFLTKIEV